MNSKGFFPKFRSLAPAECSPRGLSLHSVHAAASAQRFALRPQASTWNRPCSFLSRPYARVDRVKLKKKLLGQCVDSRVQFHNGRVSGCNHGRTLSTLECQDGVQITARLIVDATGHACRLTERDGEHNPGYQAAYGIMAGARLRSWL